MSRARVAVLKVISKELSATDAAAQYGYSRQHLHRLIARYKAGGLDAVEPRSRRPKSNPQATGDKVRVCSVRLVSFIHRPVAAICYEVEPVDGPARITVQSELTANEQLPPAGADPRVAAALEDPLRGEYHDATGTAVVLVHKTRRSGLRVGAAMDHLVDCPAPVRAESRSFADGGLVTAAMVPASGQKLRVIKFGVESP